MNAAGVRHHEARCLWNAGTMLGESPLWSAADAALYWVDILAGEVLRYRPDSGERARCRMPSAVSALALCADGALLCTAEREIHRFDVAARSVARLHTLQTDAQHIRINDGGCHADGSFWFGTMDLDETRALGTYHRLAADGGCAPLPLPACAITNGPAFSADGSRAYLVDTLARRVFELPLEAGRLAHAPRVFADIAAADGYPDGLATDSEAGVWCAQWGGSRVTRFDPLGRITDVVSLPAAHVTKCAFGGSGLDRLYITTARKGLSAQERAEQPLAGGLFEAEVGYRGFALPAYQGQPAADMPIAKDCRFLPN